MSIDEFAIKCKNIEIAYGNNILMQNVTFDVNNGDVFIVMGGSGCGKSSLMRVMIGLKEPAKGKVFVLDKDYYEQDDENKKIIMQNCGILYQSGALFSSMTLAENIALPIQEYSDYSPKMIDDLVNLKLALVGLKGYGDFYPSEISGGMKKRAGLARALALDPKILYFDEPSAGLDPVSSRLLDDLILEINQSLGTTIVVITHELRSIFAIGNNSIFLDVDMKGVSAKGNPRDLLRNPPNENVFKFLTGGQVNAETTKS